MCAIIGSFSVPKLKELILLNQYRGLHSWSLTTVNPNCLKSNTIRGKGNFPLDKLNLYVNDENIYFICHVQAPTNKGGLNSLNIHPAVKDTYKLWHNGILKHNQIEELNVKEEEDPWDTKLLLNHILSHKGLSTQLSSIDGSFACVFMQDKKWIKLFRNSTSILHVDEDLNISSAKFNSSITIPDNKIFNLNLASRSICQIGEFKNINQPYYFAE